VSFVVPCKLRSSGYGAVPDSAKSRCRATFVCHLITLITWIVAIILLAVAGGIAAANGETISDPTVIGLAWAGLVISIVTFIALIASLSFAGAALCRLNSARDLAK